MSGEAEAREGNNGRTRKVPGSTAVSSGTEAETTHGLVSR